MGYYALFVGLQFSNELSLTHKLNEDTYEISQTVTIKIPLAVPYMSDNNEFQRVDGKFEYEGEFYRLVKQKYAQDTLTIICIKDFKKKQIQEALTDYVKTFSDNPSDQQNNNKLIISFVKDYISQSFSIKNSADGWQAEIALNEFCQQLIPAFFPSVIHPPERA